MKAKKVKREKKHQTATTIIISIEMEEIERHFMDDLPRPPTPEEFLIWKEEHMGIFMEFDEEVLVSDKKLKRIRKKPKRKKSSKNR